MEFKQGSITVIDDIFTPQDCEEIIKYYNDNIENTTYRTDYRNMRFYEVVDHMTQNQMVNMTELFHLRF